LVDSGATHYTENAEVPEASSNGLQHLGNSVGDDNGLTYHSDLRLRGSAEFDETLLTSRQNTDPQPGLKTIEPPSHAFATQQFSPRAEFIDLSKMTRYGSSWTGRESSSEDEGLQHLTVRQNKKGTENDMAPANMQRGEVQQRGSVDATAAGDSDRLITLERPSQPQYYTKKSPARSLPRLTSEWHTEQGIIFEGAPVTVQRGKIHQEDQGDASIDADRRRPRAITRQPRPDSMQKPRPREEGRSESASDLPTDMPTESTSGQGPHDSMPQGVLPTGLKGLFSTSTTSSKTPEYIRADLTRVLELLKVRYLPIRGGFCCRSTPGPGNFFVHLRDQPALVFNIFIVKIPLLSLHGIQFKRLEGDIYQYRSMTSDILTSLRL
jgi:hypothetical protein